MNILVTGAAGFIGSHFAEALQKEGCQVYGIDNLSSYYDKSIKLINVADIERAGVTFREACLVSLDYNTLPQDIDFIVHFAAQPGISATTNFEEYLHNNVLATNALLHWAKQLKSLKLFVNIATSSVYGRQATSTEDEAPNPISYYGVTKLAAEQLVMAAHRLGELHACSIRLFSVYGPRERPEKLYTRLIKCILEKQSFPLFEGSDKHQRSFTYIGDIVTGLKAVIAKPEQCQGELINLGSEAVYTTAAGIALIEKIIGTKAQLEIVPKRVGDQLRTAANIDKAKRILGYVPETPFEEGLKAQVAWYKAKFG